MRSILQLPHYKQVRAFSPAAGAVLHREWNAHSNGQAETRRDFVAHEGRDRGDVSSEAGGLESSVERKALGREQFKGQALSWQVESGVIELALHRDPCNELGSLSLDELEQFASALDDLEKDAHALIIHSSLKCGFCAGADLRELYERSQAMEKTEAARGVRDFLERIHRVLNRIDAAPLTTIAAVHGVTFGGGFELALVCDLIIADKMARFCFPELRLGT